MMENIGEDRRWDDLRSRAINIMNLKSMNTSKPLSDDTTKLIQELDFYRIELELENKRMALANELIEKSRNEYVQLFDTAPCAFIVLSPEGNIKKVNFLGASLLGQERMVLLDTPFEKYISAESKELFNNFLNELYEKKTRITVNISLADELRIPNEMEISGLFSDSSKEFSIVLLDITKQKKNEKYLVQSRERAENADRLKTAFLSTMSHEIRAPLNSIIGFTSILMQEIPGTLNEEQKKQMRMIQTSGRHLLSLINDLLDLSKIEAGQLTVNFEYFDLKEVLDDVFQLEWPLAREKSLEMKLNAGNDPIIIRSDKQRMHQVLLNILNNAIKYTRKGHVDINCYREENSIKIEIKDTGIGIREEDLQKIFDPFTQLENDLTKTQKGSGLGLPVSQQLIRLLQGTLRVESQFGEGTTFTINVPSVVG